MLSVVNDNCEFPTKCHIR